MSPTSSIADLLRRGSAQDVALAAPGRPDCTYAALRAHVERTGRAVNRLGVGGNDAVAIVLPNGPEMASAFVGVAGAATAAPLNPGYRAEEFEFYLTDLEAKLLVVSEGVQTPARDVAARLGLPVAEVVSDPAMPAGVFDLAGTTRADGAGAAGPTGPDDVALVLHTSGTTSRPKIVPLSQRNVCASAAHIADSIALNAGDRCLNVMPLFHIHGLIAAVLASLHAGATIYCTPGFSALRFFTWLDDARPTWYTAVPTMHQAILERAERNVETVRNARLRLIRSSSASLPAQVMASLERTFGAPVIEAYGMTEAAHQMASNPLPPRERTPGSVGVAAGPEIAIMDETGALLPPGATGEVVIRGPNVTGGYRNNPDANAAAFTDGWFRTGDQGVLDDDGYLRLTGRLKEIINRGGEKISPREVDEVLLDHPDIRQAVTFAVAHPKLGEDVAAAVVARDGARLTERQIRAFAATRLADFKVPRTIVLVDEIPKGPTGKLQRIGLAGKLGLE